MSRRVVVSPETIEWLRESYGTLTLVKMAAHVGCHIDTLKRILVRHGIADFPAAKYQVSRRSKTKRTWTRPCLACGCIKPRPRNIYRCERCHRSTEDFLEETIL